MDVDAPFGGEESVSVERIIDRVCSAEPPPGRLGRKRSPDAKRSAIAIARLVDGPGDAELSLLADAIGLNVSTICRRAEVGRRLIASTPELRSALAAHELRYLRRRYASADDPAVREFLRGLNTPRRKRP